MAQALRTPRSAAVPGVLFALLCGAAVVLIRLSFPGGITDRGDWLASLASRGASMVSTAVHLVAYAGIAFLWFMGVVRTRIGAREDRFPSTVFVGCGYSFLAMAFVAGAMASGCHRRPDAGALPSVTSSGRQSVSSGCRRSFRTNG